MARVVVVGGDDPSRHELSDLLERHGHECVVGEDLSSVDFRDDDLVILTGVSARATYDLERRGEIALTETVDLLANALSLRREETAGHIQRVGLCSGLIADRAGLDQWRLEDFVRAAMLHDVGKIAIPDAVLLKKTPLSEEEFETIKRHSEIGHRLLAGSQSPILRLAASMALHHHERWDGSGYPGGLKGEGIPLEARVVAIADEFDAVTSERVYRPEMSLDEGFTHILAQRGTRHDADLVDAFLAAEADVRRIREDVPEPPPDHAIEVLVVDDHEMFAVSMSRLLTDAGMTVVGTVGTAGAALVAARDKRPDVVLLDWFLPDLDGATAARRLRDECDTARVLVLTGAPDDASLLEAIEAGCVGYITKDRSIQDVIVAIKAAHAGEPVMPAAKLSSLVRRLRREGPPDDNPLTPRETEILGLLAEGLSNEAIAEQLTISIHTVRNHVQQIITKLGAHSKLEAVSVAVRRGLVSYPTP